jgi:hypothetical protein
MLKKIYALLFAIVFSFNVYAVDEELCPNCQPDENTHQCVGQDIPTDIDGSLWEDRTGMGFVEDTNKSFAESLKSARPVPPTKISIQELFRGKNVFATFPGAFSAKSEEDILFLLEAYPELVELDVDGVLIFTTDSAHALACRKIELFSRHSEKIEKNTLPELLPSQRILQQETFKKFRFTSLVDGKMVDGKINQNKLPQFFGVRHFFPLTSQGNSMRFSAGVTYGNRVFYHVKEKQCRNPSAPREVVNYLRKRMIHFK